MPPGVDAQRQRGVVIQSILMFSPTFLKAAFEVSLLSLFAVCLAHSFWTHGWKRTVREFVAGFFLTAFCESIGVLSGAYVYPGFHFYIFATPVANPASWVATVYIIIEVTNGLVYGRRALTMGASPPPLLGGGRLRTLLLLAVVDALLALVVDIVMDPLATVFNWWVWVPCLPDVTSIGPGVVEAYNFEPGRFMQTPANWLADFFGAFFPGGNRYPTRVLGIPLINFIAWFVFVFVFTLEFRYVESKERWSDLKKTAALWGLILLDVPVLAFVLITPNI